MSLSDPVSELPIAASLASLVREYSLTRCFHLGFQRFLILLLAAIKIVFRISTNQERIYIILTLCGSECKLVVHFKVNGT
jgi:hypothetical protein